MNTIVTSKEEILKTAVSLSGKRAGRQSASVLSPRHAGSRSARSTTIMTPRLSLSAPRSRASGAKFSTARRTRPYFRTCRPVSNGCTSAWPTAMSSIPDSSHCTLGFMQEDKADGKRHMQQIWHHILNGLCTVLQQDTKIRPGAFNEQFTVEKFADVLFSLMLSALLRQDYDPAAVLEIVRRTLY